MKDRFKLLKGFWNLFLLNPFNLQIFAEHPCVTSTAIEDRGTGVAKRQVSSLPGRTCGPAKKKPLPKSLRVPPSSSHMAKLPPSAGSGGDFSFLFPFCFYFWYTF